MSYDTLGLTTRAQLSTGTFAAAAAAPFFDKVIVLDRDKLETRVEELSKANHDYVSLCEVKSVHVQTGSGLGFLAGVDDMLVLTGSRQT